MKGAIIGDIVGSVYEWHNMQKSSDGIETSELFEPTGVQREAREHKQNY